MKYKNKFFIKGTFVMAGYMILHINYSIYIRSIYSQCHVDLLACTEQNVNIQTLTQV